MNLFGGVISVTGISFLMLCIFGILFVGYATNSREVNAWLASFMVS